MSDHFGTLCIKGLINRFNTKSANSASSIFNPCSDERQNGFKGLKLKRCKFLQPFFTSCEQDFFVLRRVFVLSA